MARYSGRQLDQIAFPLGGIGAGMVCLDGIGGLTQASIRHRPDLHCEPGAFAAISVRKPYTIARVVEGPVPSWRRFRNPRAGRGDARLGLGLPRFAQSTFTARFPFAEVALHDAALPLSATVVGWSPFEPGDTDSACLPVAGLEYTFTNRSHQPIEAVFSYHLPNFLAARGQAEQSVTGLPGGLLLHAGDAPDTADRACWFAACTDAPDAQINHAWFRGSWFDPITMVWRDIAAGCAYERPPAPAEHPAPGGTIFVPVHLAPEESKKIRVRLAWYAPTSALRTGADAGETYRPWYASQFADIAALDRYWREHYRDLRQRSQRFQRCFDDTDLPPEAVEAAAANLSILKSPTLLRQHDGRLWGWEGCDDDSGLAEGSCTHVWHYAQALAHLFPELERSLRETEFAEGQDASGHQVFRVPLPIRPTSHEWHAALDGQLGTILKAFRDWRIGGETEWLRALWPRIRQCLDYAIETWDPRRTGCPEEPHHNTYDIEFWGANGMSASIYLAALQAVCVMGAALDEDVQPYRRLLETGLARLEGELFNGSYFIQQVEWKRLRAQNPAEAMSLGQEASGDYSPEARALLEAEGPKYQYGSGCLADGVIGDWLARVCGVPPVLDPEKVRTHLRSVHRHNLKADLSAHPNPSRPTYALGHEGGLLLCTWPQGGEPSLPFIYSAEVWTGIEYQVAAHLIQLGEVASGLEIVRTCRARYDGEKRNPFDEYEWGHWYARAMASYALIPALSGARYDAVEQVLYLAPQVPGDFRAFLATATGYGTVGVCHGEPFVEDVAGRIEIARIAYTPCGVAEPAEA
ncbi:MAG: hypothetical protein E1N59_3186 [Puniceicoccaceae bacterium 5H]|nr:MAG: hypothetical protein E1N59_3186 [Puniceicoccaceae bacterium 5H]